MTATNRPYLVADGHIPTIAETYDTHEAPTWGVYCHACSRQAETYVWPCREGVVYDVPAELVAASELAAVETDRASAREALTSIGEQLGRAMGYEPQNRVTVNITSELDRLIRQRDLLQDSRDRLTADVATARTVALSNKRAHATAYLECERLSGELETARAEVDRLKVERGEALLWSPWNDHDVLFEQWAQRRAVVSGTSQAAADGSGHCGLCGSEDCPGVPGEGCMPGPFEGYDPIAVLDAAIAASGAQLVFDPRNWTAPHTQRGPKASNPDREHPAHVGQTCDEYDAAVAAGTQAGGASRG